MPGTADPQRDPERAPIELLLDADPLIRDPYPLFERARARTPIARRRVTGMPRHAGATATQYHVFRFDLVRELLADDRRFSNFAYAPTFRPLLGRTLLELDPPEHTAVRSLLVPLFRRPVVRGRHAALVTGVADQLLDEIGRRGRAELLHELTLPFPVRVLAAVIGVPPEDLTWFQGRVLDLLGLPEVDRTAMRRAAAELRGWFGELVAARRATPSPDLVGDLLRVQQADAGLGDDEIVSFLRFLLPASIETTYRLASNLLYALLTHPEQLQTVRRTRRHLPAAIEEAARWESPVPSAWRMARKDTVLGGVPIETGSVLVAHLAAANRDPDRYAAPDSFDVLRPARPHLGFGYGPHTCLGMHLARVELEILLSRVLDRLTGLRLDPDADAPLVRGLSGRTPTALPVVFEPDDEAVRKQG